MKEVFSGAFFKSKRVLVAGGSGFVGTHLVSQLLEYGANVTATTFKKRPHIIDQRVRYIEVDLTKPECCDFATRDIEYVFMCAANSSGAAVMASEPLIHLTPNVLMNTNMLKASYANGVKKFGFISSNTVYPVTDFPVKEEDVNYEYFEKYFVVGWMKRFTEIMCEMYSEKINSPMKTVVVRPGNLYGPYDKYTKKESKVIAALIRRAVEHEDPLSVWGDGQDIKDFLFIKDFIDGFLRAFMLIDDYKPVNIASGIPITISEVLRHILEHADCSNLNVEYDTTKPTMIPKRLINIDRMERLTGWKPQTTIASGIKQTVAWYKSYYSDTSPEDYGQ